MESHKIIQVEEKVPLKLLLPLSIQHMFAMFGASVLVPFIFGINPAIVLFMNGVGTLIFIVVTKAKSPAYLGSSFAFLAPAGVVISKMGYPYALGGFVAVLVQDEVYNGNHNRAGEIGHMRLEKNGRRCYCGNYGCFDAYCNSLILKDAAGGELKDFFAGIDQGNREYERILDEYVERLSDAVFNIRMLYDDTVLIGGELGEYADYFIEKVWGILDLSLIHI